MITMEELMNLDRNEYEETDPSILYQTNVIDYKGALAFVRENTFENDYIIPLINTARVNEAFIGHKTDVDDDYISKHDDRLLRVLRRRENSIDVLNIKTLGGGKTIDRKGVIFKVLQTVPKVDAIVRRIPRKVSSYIAEQLQKLYDDIMRTEDGKVPDTTVIVPVWNVEAEEAFVITLFGRINFVIM